MSGNCCLRAVVLPVHNKWISTTHNFRYVCTDRESSVTFPNTNKRNETGEQREEGVVQNLDRWLKPFNSIQHTLYIIRTQHE